MATTAQNLQYRLEEFFGSPPTQDALEEIGPFMADLEKGPNTQVNGDKYWTGDGLAKLSARTEGSGNVGSNLAGTLALAKSEAGVQYQARIARRYSTWNMDQDEWDLTKDQPDASAEAGANSTMRSLVFTQKNFWRSSSVYGWRDGRGGAARLALNSAVGTTITLINPAMVQAFEIGDALVAYDPAVYFATQCGVLSATRGAASINPDTNVVRVVNRDERNGTLLLSAAFNTITGGAAGDVIGHFTYRQPAGGTAYTVGLYGVATFLAFNATDRTATALGVNRAVDPGRLAGRFETLQAGASLSAVMGLMTELSTQFGIPVDRVYAPARAAREFSTQLTNQTRTGYDQKMMRFGAAGAKVVFPHGEAVVTVDRFLWDIQSNADIYVGLVSKHWGYCTTKSGIHWRNYGYTPDGAGGYFKVNSDGGLQAEYGGNGNVLCDLPAKAIVIRAG
jgi:hypothetical protein